MKIYSVQDPEFREYGRVISGCDVQPLIDALNEKTPLPEATDYVAEEPALQSLEAAKALAPTLFGGLPTEFGWCNGHNTKLNCLEYHRDSELNCGTEDFVLLLAKIDDIENGKLDTGKVRAFRVPAGELVEVYATSLHYAPCSGAPGKGFRVMIALPRGTNGPKPDIIPVNEEDKTLWACNKWLLAHPESAEAAQGAPQLLCGENIDIAADL